MKTAPLFLLVLASCGTGHISHGIHFTGVPVDETVVARYASYVGFHGTLEGTVDVHPLGAFSGCSAQAVERCPYEEGPSTAFEIVTSEKSLVHELTHAMFGDAGHLREDLWGPDGTVRRFTVR